MRVIIEDDNDSWLKWGQLVQEWIQDPTLKRPESVGELEKVMAGRGIKGSVPGPDRPVQFVPYPDTGILYIPMPSKKMLADKLALLKDGPYPFEVMPHFYDVAYGGAPRVSLSQAEREAFALRRIGEYTVNECC